MPSYSSIQYQQDPKDNLIPDATTTANSEEETDTTSSSIFFSRTAIATACVGVALAVTAYFAPVIAAAATFALGVTGLAYYGVTAMLDWSQSRVTAPTGNESESVGSEGDNDKQNDKSLSRSNSHSSINNFLPAVTKAVEETKSEQLGTTLPTKPPAPVTRERSDSDASHESTHSHSM